MKITAVRVRTIHVTVLGDRVGNFSVNFSVNGEAAAELAARIVEAVKDVPELAYIATLLDGVETRVFLTDGSVAAEEPLV